MNEDKVDDSAVVDLSQWRPAGLSTSQNPTVTDTKLPIQATHPAVVAVCNVLMYDGCTDAQPWHSPAEHARTRDTMEQCISHLILQRRPTASQDWIDKLPIISRRIERNLYYAARSIDEYSDPYTLVNRIQSLVKILVNTAASLPARPPSEDSAESGEANGAEDDANAEEGEEDEEGGDTDSEIINRIKAEPLIGGPGSSETPAATQQPGTVPVPAGFPSASSLPASGAKQDLLQAPLYLMPLKEAELAQEHAAAAVATVGNLQGPIFLANRQVSSQGCSRVFIIKVLISVSEFVKGKSLPSIFTFKRELVMDWLISAKQACCLPTIMAEEGYYGGPPFVDPDPSTHWSEPHQLYTWWKNNVERRSKFKVLQEDAKYKGLDPKRLQRARWCEAVVALSEVIRASSGSSNASRTAPPAPVAAPAPSSSGNIGGVSSTGSGVVGGGFSAGGAPPLSQAPLGTNPVPGSALQQHNPYLHGLGGPTASNGLVYGFPQQDTSSYGSLLPVTTPVARADGNGNPEAPNNNGIAALIHMGHQPGAGYLNPYVSGHALIAGSIGAQAVSSQPPVAPAPSEAPSSSSSGAPNNFTDVAKTDSTGQTPLSPAPSAPKEEGASSGQSGTAAPPASSQPKPDMGGYPAGAGGRMFPPIPPLRTGADGRPAYLMGSGFRGMPPPPGAAGAHLSSHLIPGTNIPYRNYSNTFPVKLFDLVSTEDETVVGWQGHGTSFQVRNMDKFVNEILPKHFKHNNFTSFQRQLNLYGFRRSASYDKGAYYHPQFQQNHRELAESIRRVLVPHGSSGGGGGGGGSSREDRAEAASNAMSMPMSIGMGMGMHHMGMHPHHQLQMHAQQLQGQQNPYGMSGLPGMQGMQGMPGMGGMSYLGSLSQGMRSLGGPLGSQPPPSLPGSTTAGAASSEGGAAPSDPQSGADQAGSAAEATPEGADGAASGEGADGKPAMPAGQNPSAPAPMSMLPWMQTSSSQPPSYFGPGGPNAMMYNNNVYWQTLAINNMAAAGGMPGGMNPYFMQQAGYLGGQYPGAPYQPYGAGMPGMGGYPGMDGSGYDPNNPYNYNVGPYGVMTQLARNFYSGGKLRVPARGYNRNSKRAVGGEKGDGAGQKKLSARDRKLLDLHSAGGDLNAEQFLAGTMLSDRYHLGTGDSLLGGKRQYRRKKGLDGADEDDEGGRKVRGRPKGRRAGDEGTYQDGEGMEDGGRRGKRGGKARRKGDDDDSLSSASGGEKGGRGRRSAGGNRNGGSRQLSGTPGAYHRSGLSRHSNIHHLVDNAEEDLLDLRNPRKRRVHLDFTMPTIEALVAHRAAENPDTPKVPDEDEVPDYVCGFYHGVVHFGKKDPTLQYKLHGSRALPEALLKLNTDQQTAAASPVQSLASMIAAQNKNNAPRSTRVGDEYQCDVPALQPLPNAGAAGGVQRRSVTNVSEGLVWKPNALSEACVDSFLELVRARKKLLPVPVGSVLVVHLAEEKAYRLCCVLDVHVGDPLSPRAGAEPAAMSMGDASVRVFDGYEDWVVSPAECMSFQEGEMELALQLLANHNGELSPALVQEVDWLLTSERANRGEPTAWSSEEVQHFCNAVRRYGDNIKKVWELKFEDSKKIEEVQEFFLRIYPHTQLGGAKRVVSVYHRGELAAAGYPDGVQSDSEEEDGEEGEEGEEEGDSQQASDSDGSSVNSVSSDDEDDAAADQAGRRPQLGSSGKAAAAAVTVAAPPVVAAGRKVRMQGGETKEAAALKPSASSGALSTVSSNASGKRASSSTTSEALPDSSERRSGRKRGQGNNEDTPPPAPAKQKAEPAPAPADEGAKRRRR